MPWEEIVSNESLQELLRKFAYFKDALIVDIKYFSADRTNPEFPGDTSYESSIYASFLSENPEIAGDPAISNIILKFTGIDHLNIKTSKGDTGRLNGICLDYIDGKFIWSSDPNFGGKLPVDHDAIGSLPSYIIADHLSWGYGIDALEN